MNRDELKKEVRSFIANKMFKGNLPGDFTDDTKLISSRLIDSIVVLSMVNYLEEKTKTEFAAHEVSVENLDTVNIIADFLSKKLSK
ncbi:MAG: hypothetical protein JNK50_01825 [Bacteroidia bacterium]|nr:hypothetical protein [Bacteroidia bacterium]